MAILHGSQAARQRDTLAAAHAYASRGWRVVVVHGIRQSGGEVVCTCRKGADCPDAGKHPRLKDWPQHATTDEEEIVRLWERWPDANLGILLGPTSGIIDVEYDDVEGRATAERLLGDCFTPSYRSYRSTHRLFRFPEGLAVAKAVAKAQGLEIRFGSDAKGSQSVFPPSQHAKGKRYQWLRGLSPEDVEPLPFPDAVAELLAERGNGKPSGNGLALEFVFEADLQTHGGSPEGERHITLCKLVGRYLREHRAHDDLLSLALAWGERCTPPFPADEVQNVVARLAEKELAKQAATGSQPAKPTLSLVTTPFAEIAPQPVEWLWEQRFPLGKLSLLVGVPGLGKTFIACDMIAKVSRGLAFSDGSPCVAGEAAILTAEDGAGDTLRPRLDAAGADVSKVHHIECIRTSDGRELFVSLGEHLALLDDWLTRYPKARLVVIDPISAFLGRVDSHVNAEVRSVLGPVAKLAEKHGVAILGVTHLAKRDAKAINRIIGSIAFVAAARAAWLVGNDPDDESGERRLCVQVKNNLGNAPGLAFRIQDGRLEWDAEPVLVSADEMESDADASPREEAKAWLAALLAQGARPATGVWQQAKADGIAQRTLKRAKKEMGIVSEQQGGHWVWQLPDNPQHPASESYIV